MFSNLPRPVRMVAMLAALLLIAALMPKEEGQEDSSQNLTPSAAATNAANSYVLALSWSPAFCALKGYDAPREQCGSKKDFGFVVHGLWPQGENDNERPAFCANDQGQLSGRIEDQMRDIMPSAGLIQHQWRKHGTCSGLSQQDYFALTRAAFDKITIPRAFADIVVAFKASPTALERSFIEANPSLNTKQIAIVCEKNTLREVRICLDGALNFRQCPKVDEAGCRAQSIGVIAP